MPDAQQYRTADGSIWEPVTDWFGQGMAFNRVSSPDNSHEQDFHPQALNEVLQSWGALSLYDPDQEKKEKIQRALMASGWQNVQRVHVRTFLNQLQRYGYEVVGHE